MVYAEERRFCVRWLQKRQRVRVLFSAVIDGCLMLDDDTLGIVSCSSGHFRYTLFALSCIYRLCLIIRFAFVVRSMV